MVGFREVRGGGVYLMSVLLTLKCMGDPLRSRQNWRYSQLQNMNIIRLYRDSNLLVVHL